jgi:lambda repressor-like predicted transcriptional regulator
VIRLPRIRLALRPRPECVLCGSRRAVRQRKCRDCRLPEPLELRLELRGWTIAELARRAQVTPRTVHRLLAGIAIADDTRARIAAAVGLSPERLVRPRRST